MDVFWSLIKTSRVKGLGAIVFGLLSGACSAGLIRLINTAIAQGSPRSLMLPFILLVVAALTVNILTQVLLIDLSQDAVYKLRLQLSRRILAAPLQQLEQLGASKLLAVLTEDIQAISSTAFLIPDLCINIAIIVGCLVYLGSLSGWTLVAVAAFLLVAIVLVQLLINAAYQYLALVRKEIDKLYEQFRGVTEGTKELKLNATRREIFFDHDLQVSAVASRNYAKTAFKLGAIASSSGQLLFFVLMGLLLFGAAQIIPTVESSLPAYVLTITYLIGPIEKMISDSPNIAKASIAIKKVQRMGLTMSESAEIGAALPQTISQDWRCITLNNVVYSYSSEIFQSNSVQERQNRESFTVGPINLSIQPGEILFIVGGNGSGKSTLAKLITGLYFPDEGDLFVDGQHIVDSNRDAYRQLFSAVFSDFHLFKRIVTSQALTIESDAQHYLDKLQLQDKVSIENDHFSTTALSQGQRKRLSLLSAYLEDRPIYIFDEWAADQDPTFRKIFYTQILSELKQRGKTVIVISHDDHYFHVADRLIKLDYGLIESDSLFPN